MTSTQSMFTRRAATAVIAALSAAASLAGCSAFSGPPKLTPPAPLVAPYGGEGSEVLWAVAPLRNESGTTLADPLVMSDKVIAAVSETKGLRCLPLNRSIEAMRSLEMSGVRSPSDALALAKTLGVDGILVGSITAYEPYEPTLGLSLALYGRDGAMHSASAKPLDPRSLTGKASEGPSSGASNFALRPLSVYAEHLDGKNHQVLLDVQGYATGRSDPSSALGWRRYVASMDLYMEFGAHHALAGLLNEEQRRVGGATPAGTPEQKK